MKIAVLALLSAAVALPADNSALVDRVGSTGFVQLEAESFRTLSLREQTLAYWLSQAAIAIDPINYDQNSAWGLRQKRLLEEILLHPQGIEPSVMARIRDYAKLFWANRGNHNEMTAQKFLPEFTFEQLKTAAEQARRNGAFRSGEYGGGATSIDSLRASIFDPNFEPTITAKSPEGGRDILQSSANNFYSGISLADLKGFTERYPLNSRLVKDRSGKLVEEVWRAGTPDGKVPAGRYAVFLKKANGYLEKARAVAETGRQRPSPHSSATTRPASSPIGWHSIALGSATIRASISSTASSRSTAMRVPPRGPRSRSSASPTKS